MDDVIPPQSESLSLRLRVASNDGTQVEHDVINGGNDDGSLSNGADEENGGENGEEKNGGGVIADFITNLVSPKSGTKSNEFSKRKAEDEVDEIVVNGENGGGGISNMIANFFNPSEEEVKEVGNKRLKMDEEEEGKGGLIDDIVSHLRTSIPDDAAPTTDEASVLIHSCVND